MSTPGCRFTKHTRCRKETFQEENRRASPPLHIWYLNKFYIFIPFMAITILNHLVMPSYSGLAPGTA